MTLQWQVRVDVGRGNTGAASGISQGRLTLAMFFIAWCLLLLFICNLFNHKISGPHSKLHLYLGLMLWSFYVNMRNIGEVALEYQSLRCYCYDQLIVYSLHIGLVTKYSMFNVFKIFVVIFILQQLAVSSSFMSFLIPHLFLIPQLLPHPSSLPPFSSLSLSLISFLIPHLFPHP